MRRASGELESHSVWRQNQRAMTKAIVIACYSRSVGEHISIAGVLFRSAWAVMWRQADQLLHSLGSPRKRIMLKPP